MIKPAPPAKLGPDWFWVDANTARDLARRGVPGLQANLKAGVEGLDCIISGYVHRSMLPLIPTGEAARLMLEYASRVPEPQAALVARLAARGITPRPTQLDAAAFIGKRRGSLLGDDMRLGKTLSALMAYDPRTGPLVVVAPLIARGVWLGWMRRLFPGADIGVLTGTKFDRELASKPIVFAHYDILRFWQRPSEYGLVVFDEAHALTNRTAKRAIAASTIAANAKQVLALTGTPVWDLPPDFWMMLSLIAPRAFGDYYAFANRYGAPVLTAYGAQYTGLSNGDELKTRLQEVMLRRRWVDVTDELPPITRSVVVAPVAQAERNKLDVIAGKFIAEGRSNTAANLAAYRRQVAKVKLKTVAAEAARIRDGGQPVVVWTWHKEFAIDIASALSIAAREPGGLSGVWVIHGDIGADERDRRIEAWKQCPNGLLVATMAVGQVAINLAHARTAIFAEVDYTPAVIGQAEMRTFDVSRGMDIIFVVADHITDQRIIRALVRKLSAADPLGVGAAVDSIDALRLAIMGPDEVGDVDRLLEDFLASAT